MNPARPAPATGMRCIPGKQRDISKYSIQLSSFKLWGGLGSLATLHLPGGPVGPPARWAAALDVEGGSGT